jgi:outer membrane protein OmpA-like peptidoglycan-associated protein
MSFLREFMDWARTNGYGDEAPGPMTAEMVHATPSAPTPAGGPGGASGGAVQGGSAPGGAGAPAATSTDLFFDKASPKLTDSDKESLDAYASAYQRENSSEQIVVEGYASMEGELQDNLKLSVARANSVADYLTKQHGVPKAKVTANGCGATNQFSKDDLSQNRRATIKPPPNLTVRDIVKVVDLPPNPGNKPNPTLGEKADDVDLTNIVPPEPPPEEVLAEPGKKAPPEKDDDQELNIVVNPKAGTVQTEVKFTVHILAKSDDDDKGWQPLPDMELSFHVNDPGQRGLVDEAQLNLIKAHIEENLPLIGNVDFQATVSLNTQSNRTDDALEKTTTKLKGELEVEIKKLHLSVVLSTDSGSRLTFEWHVPKGDDKQKKMAEATKESGHDGSEALEGEKRAIKEEYEEARDTILNKLPGNVKEKAKNEMDAAVMNDTKDDPFVVSQALREAFEAAGVNADKEADIEAEMKLAVADYHNAIFHAMGGGD